jgi:HK97 family phage prohead protease
MPKPFEILSEDDRIVAGWASVEILDSQGDIIPIEEIERAMYILMDRGGQILYGHGNKPIGKILKWEIRKHPEADANGLWVVAKIYKDYPLDDEVWRLVKEGQLKGFSIGAQGRKEKRVLKDKSVNLPDSVNVVRDLNLMEISIVPTPANPLATIEQVNYIAKGMDGGDKKLDLDAILSKYKIDKAVFDKTEGCGLCYEISQIIKDVGDVDIGVRVWRAMKMMKDYISEDRMKKLVELAEEVKKSIDELKEYERWVNERRAEEIEEFHTPYDEFCDRLDKQLDDLWKELVDIVKPFGKWDSFDDCVSDMMSKGYSEESAKRICGSLQAKLEKEIAGLVIDLVHELDEFVKSNPDIVKDKRPPKEWFDRCVERTGRPALCGWVFYHHLYPTKPESKREPDEPHTREARSRKRRWLGG